MFDIKGTRVFVTFSGKGQPLLCLHGWGRGVSHEAFHPLRQALEKDAVEIIAPDLPGFGKSGEPPEAWSVEDYADCVEELVRELQLKDVLLLGHSFGGRIAIKLAAREGMKRHAEEIGSSFEAPLTKFGAPQDDTLIVTKHAPWLSHLFLCAAAGVGRDLHVRRTFWLLVAKIGNGIFLIPGISRLKPFARKVLYRLLRVRDYEEASARMRQTMKLVIEEDLTPLLPKITVPTDLFWGTEDPLTPLTDGELMNKKIVQSKLHIFPGIRHNVQREGALEIARVMRQVLHF